MVAIAAVDHQCVPIYVIVQVQNEHKCFIYSLKVVFSETLQTSILVPFILRCAGQHEAKYRLNINIKNVPCEGTNPEIFVFDQLRHTTRLQFIKIYFILVAISHKNQVEIRRRALNLLISLLCRTALAASKLLTGAISFHRVNDIKKKKLYCCDNPFLTQFNSSTFGEENTTV